LLNANDINPYAVIDRKVRPFTATDRGFERLDEADTVVAVSTRPYEYNLPDTAICPGCETMVVLPVIPPEDGSLPICGTCGSEVPDPRIAVAAAAAEAAADAEAEAAKPIEDRKYSRGSLLSALRDSVADKGIAALSKRIPPNIGG
jgi:hypothetical protein